MNNEEESTKKKSDPFGSTEEFDYSNCKKFDKSKPILLVKLGDRNRGWVPDIKHSKTFQILADATGLSDMYNIIIWNYGIELQIIRDTGIINSETVEEMEG